MNRQEIILYKTKDCKASVALFADDGDIWLNQNQLAELFATSKPNISQHISNVLKEKELHEDSVVKNYLTTAANVMRRNLQTNRMKKTCSSLNRKSKIDRTGRKMTDFPLLKRC